MSTILQFDSIPGIAPMYLKIIFSRKKGFRPGDAFPDIRAAVKNVTVNREKLAAFDHRTDDLRAGGQAVLADELLDRFGPAAFGKRVAGFGDFRHDGNV